MSELAGIGPVQLLLIGFPPGANFEGRIADELAKLVSEGTIRVLDLLFVAKDTDSDEVVVLEHQTENMGSVAGALLGVRMEGDNAAPDERSFGYTNAEIDEMGASLAPGESAGLLLIEHTWSRGLKDAIRDAGGRPLEDTFLTPERVAEMEPQLAALARRMDAGEA